MNRREFLQLAGKSGIGLGVAGALAGSSCMPRHTRKPNQNNRINILFLMDDQHRADSISAESKWVHTPNLDQLAIEGTRFTRAYSSTPSCIPARAGILTGQAPWSHGLLCYMPMAKEYPVEMPRTFTNAGYRTHAVGKNHFASHKHGYQTVVLEEAWRFNSENGFKCDYRKWFEKNYPDKDPDATGLGYTDHRGGRPFLYDDDLHATNFTADRAADFLTEYQGPQPWFLKVSFKRPHPPFDPPRRFWEKYKNVNYPEPVVGDWAREQFGGIEFELETSPHQPRGKAPADQIRAAKAAYYASIEHVDEQIGKVLRALKQRGEYENTLILFTSDHGEMMGDHYLWRKTYPYEASTRIPMIVRWPDSLAKTRNTARGQVRSHLVELRDIFPTFLDAAGLDIPETVDGESMLNVIADPNAKWREVLDLEHGTCYWKENSWVALTDAKYKYVYFTISGRQQLFDLANDPDELYDLAKNPEHRQLLKSWEQKMIAHLACRGLPWLKDGKLNLQKKAIPYSPNFPTAESGA